MKINKTLYVILEDLEKHKGRSKQEILQQAITERLNKSLQVYYNSISYSADFLSRLDNNKRNREVLKNIDDYKET